MFLKEAFQPLCLFVLELIVVLPFVEDLGVFFLDFMVKVPVLVG